MSELTIYDALGNPLRELHQWDINQKLVVRGLTTQTPPVFHFCTRIRDKALVVTPTMSGQDVIANIPNILLTEKENIVVYLYTGTGDDGFRSVYTIRIPLYPRQKPDDYEYVENIDYPSYADLDARITGIDHTLNLTVLQVEENRLKINEVDAQVSQLISSGAPIDPDSELANIRVAVDGDIYELAGDAVRGQVRKVLTDVVEVTDDEPTSFYNKMWVNETDDEEVVVPTMEEFNETKNSLDELSESIVEISDKVDNLSVECYDAVEDKRREYFTLSFVEKSYANSANVSTVNIATLSGYKYAVAGVTEGDTVHVTTYWHQNIKAVIFTDDTDRIIEKHPTTSASHQLFDDDLVVPAGATKMYVNGETVVGRTESTAYKEIDNGVIYKVNVSELSEKLGIKSAGESEKIVCVKVGDDIQIRSECRGTEYGIALNAVIGGSKNKGLNFDKYILLNSSVSDDVFATGTMYKDASDDICPFKYGGSYRGGNHGYALAHMITANAHGLTESDIGSVWTSDGKDYVLVSIVDANKFIIVYTTSFVNPVSPLTHKSGATHTGNIAFTAQATTQIVPGAKNVETKIYSDNGTELTEDGCLVGKYIDVVETGYLIDVPKMKDYLIRNVGSNTNTSYYSENIDADVMYQIIYRFFSSGCCLVSTNIVPISPVSKLEFAGFVQAQTIGNNVYVPYSSIDTIAPIVSGSNVLIPSMWNDAEFPPYKFYQFNADKGFALGYVIDYGQGMPSVRKNHCAVDAGNFNVSTKKMYPYFVHANENIGMKPVSGYAFRSPSIIVDDITVVWYEVGDARYYEIEIFNAFDGFIHLDGSNGKRIEVVKSDRELNLTDILVDGIYVKTDTHCSITIKCY